MLRKQNSTFKTAFVSEAGSELKNNDYFGYVELDKFACYVIADGITDMPDAESAKNAIFSVIQAFHEHPSMKKSALRGYLKAANKEFLQTPGRVKKKASVTVVVTDYVKMRYACAGNTRLRLYRGGKLFTESKDMSLSRDLVDDAELPEDMLAKHEERNNLYAYLGMEHEFKPYISKKVKLINTDIIVLYTRGIWENLDSGELDDLFSEAQDDPQKSLDDAEDMLLSRQPKNLENYTIVTIFVDKVFTDPNRRRRIKRIIIISVIVILVIAIITVVIWLVLRNRAQKREDMNTHLDNMFSYIEDNNFVKAQTEAEKAYELAKKLRDKEKKSDLDAYQKLIDSVLNADETLADGKYEDAQEAYLTALDRARYADNLGKDYIEKNLQRARDYTEVYDLISDGDLLSDKENYEAAEQKYNEAKKLAAGLYFTDGKKDAAESLDKVYAAISDQVAADKETKKEAEAKAQEEAQKKAEASTAAADLIAQGDKAMQDGDTDGALAAYTMAQQKLTEIEDAAGVAKVDQKLALANKAKQENEMLQGVADKYVKAGEQALADGDPEKAQEYFNKAKGIYADQGMDKMADLMENKLAMDDPEAAQAIADNNGTSNASGKTTAGNVTGNTKLTAKEKQELLSSARSRKKRGDEAYDDGEYMKAKRYYREARDLYEELGMDKMVDEMEDLMDDADKAYDKEVEDDVNDLKDKYSQAQRYEDQGDTARYAGRYDEAVSLYQKARSLYSDLDKYDRVSDVQSKIDAVQRDKTKLEKARAYETDGDDAMSEERYEDAIEAYRKARAAYMELGQYTLASDMQGKVDAARKALADSSSSDNSSSDGSSSDGSSSDSSSSGSSSGGSSSGGGTP